MSGLLLDTHVWLWYAEGVSDRLRPAAVGTLDAADGRRLARNRRVGAPTVLMATARVLDVPLATRDEQILRYARQGFLRVIRV